MNEKSGSDPQTFDDFTVIGRLGTGGFGTVYRAVTQDGREVALKVLRPELADNSQLRNRLAREGLALKRVTGSRTVKVIDVVTEGESPYLVLELLEGTDLEKFVTSNGPLAGPYLWTAVEGLVEAISDIHNAGVIHRDLKPSNVFFGPDGIKVLDFGVSSVAEGTALTQTGAFIGTAAWVSPEQILDNTVGVESDIFNLGLVIAYLATGRHPFGSGRADAVMYRICNSKPTLENKDNPIMQIVARCLAKNPTERPTLNQLKEFLDSDGQRWPSPELTVRTNTDTEDRSGRNLAQQTTDQTSANQMARTRVVQVESDKSSIDRSGSIEEGPSTSRQRRKLVLLVPIFLCLIVIVGVVYAITNASEESTPETVLGNPPPTVVAQTDESTQSETPVQTSEAPQASFDSQTVLGLESDQFEDGATTTPSPENSQSTELTTPITNPPTNVSSSLPASGVDLALPTSSLSPSQPDSSVAVPQPTTTETVIGTVALSVTASTCGERCLDFRGVAEFPFPIDSFAGPNIRHGNTPGMTGASSFTNSLPNEDKTRWTYAMTFRYEGTVSCSAIWDFGVSYVRNGTRLDDSNNYARVSSWSGALPNC